MAGPPPARGIQNVSAVSCHVACAVQILCHAIPPVRRALKALCEDDNAGGGGGESEDATVRDGDGNEDADDDHVVVATSEDIQASPLVLELVDFVRTVVTDDPARGGTVPGQDDGASRERANAAAGNRPHHQPQPPWDPRRLYSVLRQPTRSTPPSSSSSSSPVTKTYVVEPDEVGDPATTLSHLLHRLRLAGPVWDALLRASVWEGRTLQVLRGRRTLTAAATATIGCSPPMDAAAAGRDHGPARGLVLQRTKAAPRGRPMVCPLVVTVGDDGGRTGPGPSSSSSSSIDATTKKSLDDALRDLLRPHVVDGTPYPWDGLNPEAFVEQIIPTSVATKGDQNDDDDNNNNTNNSKVNGEGEGHAAGSTDTDDDDDSNEWVTTKRIEFQQIPRVWLLHLDRRRRGRHNQQRRRRSSASTSTDRTDEGEDWPSPTIDIPLYLDPKSLASSLRTSPLETGADHSQMAPPSRLTLQGAIIQVSERNGGEDVETTWGDDLEEEGHCVTLLRTSDDLHDNQHQDETGPAGRGDTMKGVACHRYDVTHEGVAASWVLIDDEDCQAVEQDRALTLMGGTMEIQTNDGGRDDQTTLRRFYAATLLVYAIPDDPDWDCSIEEIVNGWRSLRRARSASRTLGPALLVGKRLRVKWAKGKYYSGRVTHYDETTGKHRVTYDDGDFKEYHLAKKTVEWVDD
jgi:hypothetical protein